MTANIQSLITKVSEEEVKTAIKTIISWVGDNPNREGLVDTPTRVVKSFSELFSGYNIDPKSVLKKTFNNNYQYQDFVLLKNIEFISTCEHHILPIIGIAHIAYIPNEKIVGISKLARVVEILSRRLQIQENMTMQIANVIQDSLDTKGVAVVIEAAHLCMSARGVNKRHSKMRTSYYTKEFQDKTKIKNLFLNSIK